MSIHVDTSPYACRTCDRPTLGWVLESLQVIRFASHLHANEVCAFCQHGSPPPLPKGEPQEPFHVQDLDRARLPAVARRRLDLAARTQTINDVRATVHYALGAAQACETGERPRDANLIRHAVIDLWTRDAKRRGYDPTVEPLDSLMRAEIMRRVGAFDDALAIVDRVLPTLEDATPLHGLFLFERHAILKRSSKRPHSMTTLLFESDGACREQLQEADQDELRAAGVTDLDELLRGQSRDDVLERHDVAGDISLRRRKASVREAWSKKRARARKTRDRARYLFQLAETRPDLKQALSFWSGPKTFLKSSLINRTVLFEMSVDALVEHLTRSTIDRCPHCTFRNGFKTVNGVGTCDHCGWPSPKYSRRRGRRKSPSRISINVRRMILEHDAALRRHEI